MAHSGDSGLDLGRDKYKIELQGATVTNASYTHSIFTFGRNGWCAP
jgi:hypothetical protein